MIEKTQVAIVGAGPAGLMLAHLLHLAGVTSTVLERRDRAHVEGRIRAGVIEHGAAELLRAAGVGGRMDREGLVHEGIQLHFAGSRHRIDFAALTGRRITVYGQQEVVKDLVQARLDGGGDLRFDSAVESIDPTDGRVHFRRGGRDRELQAELVAACDGSHGVGRQAVAPSLTYRYDYPHAWLGVLARTPPPSEELVYAYHQRGFALHSMRSPELSRLYLQVGAGETLAGWPEERMWEELRIRLGEPELHAGEILDIGITAMRSQVVEPMQAGRLYLAGDAAHIVPPTGAKGMNLALGDVTVLARAMVEWFRRGSSAALERYSSECAGRVWRAQRFSWFMTDLLHRDAAGEAFAHKLRLANLDYTVSSRAASQSLAESYVGSATDGIHPELLAEMGAA